MVSFTKQIVGWLLLLLSGCAQAADSSELYELRESGVRLSLELKSNGTADFHREFEDVSGALLTFHSTKGSWIECKGAQDRALTSQLELDKIACFVVEVVGTDEQGEARLGMMFVRKGDSLTQVMENGPTFVLKRRSSTHR